MQTVQGKAQYKQIAKDVFMDESNADARIISFALARTYTIVSHEGADPNIKKKVPIPNVCADMGIEYCDLFEILR